MKNKKWMIYGANGYTGRLIVDEAIRRGLKPVLAGRSTDVVAIASKNGLESKRNIHLELIEFIEKNVPDKKLIGKTMKLEILF